MCGRFTLTSSGEEIAAVFALAEVDALALASFSPRYNIAPTQDVLAVRAESGRRIGVGLHWGLVPHWAQDASMGARMINARSETAATKPAFRDALRARRCLIPASGFFEWGRRGRAAGPHWFHPEDEAMFAFAGLWSSWRDAASGRALESCTILTRAADETVAPVHDRMPVMLLPEDVDRWLDPAADGPALLEVLQTRAPRFGLRRVSKRVNDVRRDDAACIEAEVEKDAGEALGPLFGGDPEDGR